MQHDLSFVTTDEIFEELQKRYDAVVLVGTRGMTETADATDGYWAGGGLHCAGLCNWVIYRLMRGYGQGGDTDIEDEDE